jgi:hypothetical protein
MTQKLVWPISPQDLDNLAFIKKETTRLVKEYNEKKHLIQNKKTPQQILRDYRVNISKSRVALLQRMTETDKQEEISSEAVSLKGFLEAVSSILAVRQFSKEDERQENSESGGKKVGSCLLIENRILLHTLSDSLAKSHRVINLLLEMIKNDQKKSNDDLNCFISLIDTSLQELDDLVAWCLKETNQSTLPIPATTVCQISSQKKRKFEGHWDSMEIAPLSSDRVMSSWCQEMQQKYPDLSFPSNETEMFRSGLLHLTSTSRDLEFHLNLSFDLSSTPLHLSLDSVRKNSRSSLPSLVTPFSSHLSLDSHHQSHHTSPLLSEMERNLNQMIQAFRSQNENAGSTSSITSLIERIVVYFSEEISALH